MKKSFRITFLSLLMALTVATQTFAVGSVTALRSQIDALVKKYPSTQFAGEIITEDGTVLYAKNPTLQSQPASNMKLFSTAATLATLGDDFTFETSVYGARPKNGIVSGDVVLYGRGDPTLMDTDIADLAKQLADRGITRINGNIIADESYLSGSAIPPGRNAVDIAAYYGAELSALSVYENLTGITLAPGARVGAKPIVRQVLPADAPIVIINNATTGSAKAKSTFLIKRGATNNTFVISGVIPLGFPADTYYLSVHNPALITGTMFAKALARENIIVAGTVQTTKTPAPTSGMRELASVESDTLEEIVIETNKRSNNLFAELLLRQLGRHTRTTALITGAQTDETLGIAAVKTYLEGFGIDTNGMILLDGSGLGKGSKTSPKSMTMLLRELAQTDIWDSFKESLPIAGVDGTLKNRLIGTPAQGTVRAKTGTLDTATTLSGTIDDTDGTAIYFSFFTSHKPKAAGGRILIDSITQALARYATGS